MLTAKQRLGADTQTGIFSLITEEVRLGRPKPPGCSGLEAIATFLPKEEYLLFAWDRNDGQGTSHISARRAGVKRRYAVIFLARN